MSDQSTRVIAALRRMIVDGELAPGERIAEIPIAERLGVSRTPIRVAFRVLEQEGLLVSAGGRGYLVRQVTAEEVRDAIELRGALEGLAAGLLAQRGMTRGVRAALLDTIERGDALFEKGFWTDADMEAYNELNSQFHRLIVEASGNKAIAEAVQRNDHLPFASATSIAVDRAAPDKEFARFHFAHLQHHVIFDALNSGESARAEAMMREHANAALRYAEMFGRGSVQMDRFAVISAGG